MLLINPVFINSKGIRQGQVDLFSGSSFFHQIRKYMKLVSVGTIVIAIIIVFAYFFLFFLLFNFSEFISSLISSSSILLSVFYTVPDSHTYLFIIFLLFCSSFLERKKKAFLHHTYLHNVSNFYWTNITLKSRNF